MLSCSAERASGGSGVLETSQVSSIPHSGSQRANETVESQMTSNAVSTQAGMQGRLIVGSLCMYTLCTCMYSTYFYSYIPVPVDIRIIVYMAYIILCDSSVCFMCI